MKKFFAYSITVLFAAGAFAGESINIKVKGMVCSFCAQGIKKTFSGQPGVSNVAVNLDDKWVKVDLSDGAILSDEKVRSLIGDAGYNVESIDRAGAGTK